MNKSFPQVNAGLIYKPGVYQYLNKINTDLEREQEAWHLSHKAISWEYCLSTCTHVHEW